MFDETQRMNRGEIRRNTGVAIINPYGGIWTDELFETVAEAREYLKSHHPNGKHSEFKFAMAVRTIELYRKPGEPEYV